MSGPIHLIILPMQNEILAGPSIRRMLAADIPAVLTVQAQCYVPAMNEAAEVIAQRLAQASDFAWVAERGQEIGAYLVTYPSRVGKLTLLGDGFTIAEAADCLYIHDLAVAPRHAGFGLGRQLLEAAEAHACRLDLQHAALVSVQDSRRYWESLGFTACKIEEPAQVAALASYPSPALYMTRRLA